MAPQVEATDFRRGVMDQIHRLAGVMTFLQIWAEGNRWAFNSLLPNLLLVMCSLLPRKDPYPILRLVDHLDPSMIKVQVDHHYIQCLPGVAEECHQEDLEVILLASGYPRMGVLIHLAPHLLLLLLLNLVHYFHRCR